ncbi:sensor histidine kinase [Arthrobacter humicola]|uniref:histidine kinase n=1 Tax=Arthrobacter humicola TaxID=409291 RepID=A0ABP5KPA2_9MICC
MIDAVPVKDASTAPADASFAEITARRRGWLRRYLLARPRVMDVLVVLCYLLLVTPTAVESLIHGEWQVTVLLAAAAPVLLFRRSRPVQVTAAVGALELAVTFLHPWGSNVSAGLWFALYAVAVVRNRRFALAALAVTTAPLVLLYFMLAVGPLDGRLPDMAVSTPENFQLITSIAAAISITLSNVIATGIGISVRQRREHEHEIAAWAARAQQLGSVTERNRIAREMHDVVAHSLTVMISLSDGAAVVVKKDPQRAAGVLEELSRTGRTALADMRRVLGVLRDDSGAGHAPREPLVDGGSLAKLLEGFRTAGLPLHYTHTGPALPGDAAFQLTVYRIVQESLTNVLRYGRALSRVDVGIVRNGLLVTIDVADDGRGTVEFGGPGAGAHADSRESLGTGQGIAGMRERAKIYAGTVQAGHTGNGGWRVHAELNCNEDTATPPAATPTALIPTAATQTRGNSGRQRSHTRSAGG